MDLRRFKDFVNKSVIRQGILLLGFMGLFSCYVQASEVVEVTPLTNRIIRVYFDDGYVEYPNNLIVDRLDIAVADDNSVYSLTSSDDANYSSPVIPVETGRKTKGMEFVSNSGVPWVGSSFDPTGKPWASEHSLYLFFDEPLEPGKTYTLNTGTLASNGEEWTFTFDINQLRSEAVHVNTLGYAPQAPKYGCIYQWMGNKGNLNLSDYQGKAFHLVSTDNNQSVFQGIVQKRASATDPETGQANDTPDRNFLGAEVYECDFSGFSDAGEYKLVVEDMGSSYPFIIGDDPVWQAYYHGARSLYHQRSGIRLAPPYTQDGYVRPVTQNTQVTSDDGTDFSGLLLYCTLPWVEWDQGEGGGSSKSQIRDASIGNPLDVAGWYHDAGDWDSYAHHHKIPNMLMSVFEAVPQRFMDGDLNIPESGNGIPDIVDEASWLVKFNYRLRKELEAKGYSDGGVGGARVAPDFFNEIDGSAESDKPSWKDHRRYVVTSADAYMTYIYANQAAQLAYILKNHGKNPENFPVEMLDHVDLEQMTVDQVNWIQEAEEAWTWASDPNNQPSQHAHYKNELWVYRMNAAVQLYRLTGNDVYHQVAIEELNKVKGESDLSEVQSLGVYGYLLTRNVDVDKQLQSALEGVIMSNVNLKALDAAGKRGLRWGGVYDMPMLVGQGTTPWMFDAVMTYGLIGSQECADVVHTTADYFLGSNPLHTTWMTGVGPRPARGGFHLDTRYLWDENWNVYPGFVPYGPWSMAYDYNPYTWTIDGVEMEGGGGPWNKDWANFSMNPFMSEWPGHERYNNNVHAPMSTENTIHQQSVHVAITYGFVNNRQNTNAAAPLAVGSINLDQATLTFNASGESSVLTPVLDRDDASFASLKWSSSNPRVAHVDGYGRVTALTGGTAVITCSTLDGSVSAECSVTCNWVDTTVNSISISPASLQLVEGQKSLLTVDFDPVDASNQFVDWSYDPEGIVEVDELNQIKALAPGNVTVTATSVKDAKTAQMTVEVFEKTDYMIADFDVVVPVTTEPQPDVPQLYTPGGTNDVEAANPLKGLANNSDLVFEYGRPEGEWKLFGIVLPTDEPQELSRYSQLQFKYFGKGIFDFLIQLKTEEGTEIEIFEQASGEDCWQLFTYDLESELTLNQVNVFVNRTGNPASGTFYFDDFLLSAEAAIPFNELSISESSLDMQVEETTTLEAFNQGEPFTWVSSSPFVASVDQQGVVTAISDGTTTIKAVSLYGNKAECTVTVDGGQTGPQPESQMILDFEGYALDWNPYGAYAFASDQVDIVANPMPSAVNSTENVFQWNRDGSNVWGGAVIQFPQEETGDWESFVFEVYSDQPMDRFTFSLMNEDVIIEGITLENLNVEANTWTKIEISISDLVTQNTTFNRVELKPFGGEATVASFYFDNLRMEILPTSLITDKLDEKCRIFPNPSTGNLTIQSGFVIKSVEIFDMRGGLISAFRNIENNQIFISNLNVKPGVYLVKIVGRDGEIDVSNLVVK